MKNCSLDVKHQSINQSINQSIYRKPLSMGYLIPRLVISLSKKKKKKFSQVPSYFPKYFPMKKKIFRYWTFLNPHRGIFFYRFVRVVRKNVLEYIIALVVVKNKVRLKKCLKKYDKVLLST